jgi:hypothetical protein
VSNVTLNEIIDLTADAFSISRREFRAKGKPKHRVCWEQFARHCALMLARRHTTAGWGTIAKALGSSVGGKQQGGAEGAVERFEQEVEKYPLLRAIVADIEQRIDAIHELRSEQSASLPRYLAGCAVVAPQQITHDHREKGRMS